MFKKRKCKKCGKKISEEYRFCPYCGASDDNYDEGDWGLLGRDDFLSKNSSPIPNDFNMIFNSLMKNLGKQLNNMSNIENNPNKKLKKQGFSISISSSGNNPAKIKVNKIGAPEKTPEKKLPEHFSKNNIKKFNELQKKEPKTSIRRLSDKVIYEISLPDVKNLENISIIKLENSIEIKAIGKNCAYEKRIPLNLPIIDYSLVEEKLVLEFAIKD